MNFIDIIKSYNPINEQEKTDKLMMLSLYEKYENKLLDRDNLIAHISVSAWITNKYKNKVLLNFHNLYQNWGWLGGHADGNGDLLAVAIKEIKEESGLTNIKLLDNNIISLEALPVFYHYKHNKFVPSHIHLNVTYLFLANEEDELKIKPDENSGLKWVYLDDVNNMTNEEIMKPIYTKLNNRIKALS